MCGLVQLYSPHRFQCHALVMREFEHTAGLEVVLYALAADGTPGLSRGETGPDGEFSFTGVSGEPEIVYLVGVRYLDVPYGERLSFPPGRAYRRAFAVKASWDGGSRTWLCRAPWRKGWEHR